MPGPKLFQFGQHVQVGFDPLGGQDQLTGGGLQCVGARYEIRESIGALRVGDPDSRRGPFPDQSYWGGGDGRSGRIGHDPGESLFPPAEELRVRRKEREASYPGEILSNLFAAKATAGAGLSLRLTYRGARSASGSTRSEAAGVGPLVPISSETIPCALAKGATSSANAEIQQRADVDKVYIGPEAEAVPTIHGLATVLIGVFSCPHGIAYGTCHQRLAEVQVYFGVLVRDYCGANDSDTHTSFLPCSALRHSHLVGACYGAPLDQGLAIGGRMRNFYLPVKTLVNKCPDGKRLGIGSPL
jgi:hypothetical protein